jgi:uncharacterized protein YdeI (YjbR/CyaY-like superfamily)
MQPAGLSAFERRTPDKSAVYSYEREWAALSQAEEQAFRANPAAWEFFADCPASYRKAATWWVVSAKKDDTRRRRLDQLIKVSAHARILDQFRRRDGKK